MNASKDELNIHRLSQKHREMDERLEVLAAIRFPSEHEQLEEAKLKKMKLKLKDEIESLLAAKPELTGRSG